MKFKGRCVEVMLAAITEELKIHNKSNVIKVVSFLAGGSPDPTSFCFQHVA